MNLDELRKLSPEQAMQAAATDLSLPTDFFDRMWAQESGRGRNKLSPVGARGDFQIMPKTQRAWEQRHGKAFDADNFHDSLFMAQETMRENLKRFKDPVDATRAYNGGWDPKKWGNAETTGYVQALWGNRAPSKPGAPPVTTTPEEWPRLATLPKGKQAPDSTEDTNAVINVGTSAARLAKDATGVDAARATGVAAEAAAASVQARKDGVGVTDVAHDALRDPRVMPTWSVMNRFNAEPADPSFDYMARREELEAGMNDDEREYMRENVTSEAAAMRVRGEIEYRRGVDQTYGDAGPLKAFLGQAWGGLADPASLALGLGTVKAFQMARIASGALAASGRGGAAAMSMLGENAAANLVIEGVSDAVGEVKTTADYAMAAAAGAVLVAPFTRGVMRSANEASIANHARSIHERGVAEQSAAVTRVMQDEPTLTPQQAARRVEESEADNISAAVRDAVGPSKQDAVIPDDVRRSMEDEFQGVTAEEHPVIKPAAEAAETPVLKKEVQPSFVEQLRTGKVTRNIDDGESVVTLDYALKGRKLAGHGSVDEALGALATHKLATPVEKRLAQYLQRVLNDDALAVDVRFSKSKGSSLYDPNTQQVEIRDPATGADGTTPTIGAKVQGLTKYGVQTLLHEVFHAATTHRIHAWEQARENLRPAQRKILDQYDNLFQRFQATVFEGIPEPKGRHGPHYSAKNLHEFTAQFFTDTETRHVLAQMPGKPVAGMVTTALREFMSIIRRVMGVNGKSALEEGAKLIDQMIAMPFDNVQFHNGKPALFGPEAPKVTETPEFKAWFGKSKVVGVDGQPRRMYHGTSKSQGGDAFTSFDTYGGEHGLFGSGTYFTDHPEVASSYTNKGRKRTDNAATVYPVYLKIEKPLNMDGPAKPELWAKAFNDVDFAGDYAPNGTTNEAYFRQVEEHFRDSEYEKYEATQAIQEGIMGMGFDGVTHIGGGRYGAGDGPRHRVFIAFDPEQIKSATGNNGNFDPASASILEAPAPGAGFNPLAARRSRDKWAEKITDYARTYMASNPIDVKRLKVLTDKIGGVSDGLKLAMSQNPIMQLVASLVTETTTGAAGRKANVAIRSHMLHKKFIGNTMLEYDNAYKVFRSRNGGGVMEDAFTGAVRRKFDETVTEEVLSRRLAEYTPHRDQTVVEAADALERLFDRSRMGQVDAGVLGFGNLPATSRGYLPQALDGAKLQAASVQDLALLHSALSAQFQARLGWDKKWADDFAPFYTERVRRRSQGSKNIDALGAGGEGLQGVRDALDEMAGAGGGISAELIDRMRAATSQQGQGHTKKRLDIDLLTELRPGVRLLDFYVSNPLILARSYAKRTAGTSALTEAGIHGIRGMRELREASLLKQDGTQPTQQELEAFDRVMAEVLGTPIAGESVSAGLSNLQLLVTLQRLGGLVFTQAAETFNMIHHLGLRSVLTGVPDLPRMLGEVGRLKRGDASGNHILTSIEAYGGEIGMEGYKMVAPLDAPDAALSAYMNQPGLLTRMMRGGTHLQSKISGFRGLMAAQHRMVAEQIVMKAARFIRDGKSDVALADMGFSPEVAASLRNDLQHVAKWDANDRLVEFDLTRVSDARTAEAFVQAVHRGTSQIIQGTFIGERNAWFHKDYMRLLLQLRTFGLTATEKQWGRTRMNHGYTYAAGMLLGQMALSLPIHAARVQLMSAGREDREKYIKDNMHPAALVRATMNYSSLSGVSGDVLEIMSGVAGGWGDQRTKEILGARQQATSIGRIVPIAGSVDTGLRVMSGKADVHTVLKQLPFSNLWYLVPAINLTKDD